MTTLAIDIGGTKLAAALVEHYLAQEPAAYHVELLAAHYRHDAGLLGAALLARGE